MFTQELKVVFPLLGEPDALMNEGEEQLLVRRRGRRRKMMLGTWIEDDVPAGDSYSLGNLRPALQERRNFLQKFPYTYIIRYEYVFTVSSPWGYFKFSLSCMVVGVPARKTKLAGEQGGERV